MDKHLPSFAETSAHLPSNLGREWTWMRIKDWCRHVEMVGVSVQNGLRWPKVVTRNTCGYAVACGYSEKMIFASDKSAKLKIMSTRFWTLSAGFQSKFCDTFSLVYFPSAFISWSQKSSISYRFPQIEYFSGISVDQSDFRFEELGSYACFCCLDFKVFWCLGFKIACCLGVKRICVLMASKCKN